MRCHPTSDWIVLVVLLGCTVDPPGYSATQPTKIACGCHDGDTCYEETAALAAKSGETANDGEELLYLAQCACFQESLAGCNTLAHFAKDYVAECERGDNIVTACTIAGFVHRHGVRVPRLSGRTFPRDPASAYVSFERACQAGSAPACRNAQTP